MTTERTFKKHDRVILRGNPKARGRILHADAEVGDGPYRVQWDYGKGESNHSAEQLAPAPPYPPQALDDRDDRADIDYGQAKLDEHAEAKAAGWEQ